MELSVVAFSELQGAERREILNLCPRGHPRVVLLSCHIKIYIYMDRLLQP